MTAQMKGVLVALSLILVFEPIVAELTRVLLLHLMGTAVDVN